MKRIGICFIAILMMFSIYIPISAEASYAGATIPAPKAKNINYTCTGNQAKDIVEIARTQIGYKEGTRYWKTVKGNRIKYVPTAYGNYFGGYHDEWCAIFVCWCAEKAGVKKSVIPTETFADPNKFYGKYYARGKVAFTDQ